MKKRRKKPILHPKHLFITLSVLCVILVLFSFKFSQQFAPFKTSVGNAVSPMQKGINTVGKFLSDQVDLFQSKKSMIQENNDLKDKVDSLTNANKILAGENVELDSYRELFTLDKKYPDYPKVAARVISRDGNNWYNVFIIDKGSKDGIAVDMNVIAGKGLVGIVSEVGDHYAKVRAIIDDKSNVSAMFVDTNETCIVKGNLKSIYNGYIDVELISPSSKVKEGDEVFTSQISEKFVKGLLVGYLKDVTEDSAQQTKTAHLIPAVSFDNLDIVLVITTKKDSTDIGDLK